MHSSITDFLSENTNIIIIIGSFLLCIIIGYFGDKRFKRNNILEKNDDVKLENNSEKEMSNVQTLGSEDNTINQDNDLISEIPVFDTPNINNIGSNDFDGVPAQNEMNNSELSQFIDDALTMTTSNEQINQPVSTPQEFPYSQEDNINNIF